jgi:DNA helicase-2/ATP-dependent DNA helicase PcrA
MDLLDGEPKFRRRFVNRIDHLIVDEYQDVNYGQEQLIRLLAGTRADVMVVGDDDQTIYEWRGARPYYILEGFKQDFANKPVVDYVLSHSFRFGPLIAQTAHNVITFNKKRAAKPLVAHDALKASDITIIEDDSEQATSIAVRMAEEIETLVRKHGVAPADIAVLGRTFVQMAGLQATFIERKIPFRVLGQAPFFERDENRTLIDYVRLALAWDKPANTLRPWRAVTAEDDEESAQERAAMHYRRIALREGLCAEAVRIVLAVANTPSRMLARTVLQKAVQDGHAEGMMLGASVEALLDAHTSPLPEERRESLQELVDFVRRIAERCSAEPTWKAGEALQWVIDSLDYCRHFSNYYGEGQDSAIRAASVQKFVGFAQRSGKTLMEFVEYLRKLDPTLGLEPDKVITMTTVHRTKGLEYDYVFIPECTDGNMPVHYTDQSAVYDRSGTVPEQPLSPALESERRLFYVASTRAKQQLYIGTIVPPPRGQQSASSLPLPSRFLDEMRLPPTRDVIGAMKKTLRTGDTQMLLTAMKQWQAHTTIIRHVLERYVSGLPALNSWVRQLLQLLESDREEPFQYSHAYPELAEAVPPPSGAGTEAAYLGKAC